jgi:hypothetical protein
MGVGASLSTLSEIVSGKHAFAAKLKAAKRPMIVIGSHAMKSKDTVALCQTLAASTAAGSDWKVSLLSGPFVVGLLHTSVLVILSLC